MKRGGRDISIFSMSALDLFASALGAFILIAIVLFPFFPNISPEEAVRQLAKSQAELRACQAEKNQCAAELEALKVPPLDIVIALDITGSMENQINELKSQTKELSAILNQIAPSVGVGIVAFGDANYDRPLTQHPIVDITDQANVDKLNDFVNALESGIGIGGGDNSVEGEAIDLALAAAIAMNWRGESQRKYIIIVTDDVTSAGTTRATLNQARKFSSTDGNVVSAVLANDRKGVRTYLKKLTAAGKGEMIDSGGSMLGSTLLAILR